MWQHFYNMDEMLLHLLEVLSCEKLLYVWKKKTGVLKPFVVCKIYSTDHLSTDFKKMI